MKPLIDADVLRYEVGFSGQYMEEDGNLVVLDFEFVKELLDAKIKLICDEVDATEPPTLYLSADKFIINNLNRASNLSGKQLLELRPNFREQVATTKPYKGTRKEAKPFHFYNLTAYMLSEYDCFIANGIEADDAMCITQYDNYKNLDYRIEFGQECAQTIICSRDKDLRQCPGWHYSWECGKQPSIGPIYTDDIGWLEQKSNGKVLGYGKHFFYYQMLVGDSVDNIPGVKGIGPRKAFKALAEAFDGTELSLYQTVVKAYQEAFKDDWKATIREMANLLWMVRELNEDGSPVLYKPLKV